MEQATGCLFRRLYVGETRGGTGLVALPEVCCCMARFKTFDDNPPRAPGVRAPVTFQPLRPHGSS